MRFLLAGGQHDDALAYELRLLGHVVDVPDETNWYLAAERRSEMPRQWGRAVRAWVEQNGAPDVFVLVKGAAFRGPDLWVADPSTLWWMRQRSVMLYLSYDDPAFTPVALAARIPHAFHLWGTVCQGIVGMFDIPARTRVFEHWLAWDRRVTCEVVPEWRVSTVLTGTPYWRPFPKPHYQNGLAARRLDYARVAAETAPSFAVWGPGSWLDAQDGGSESMRPHYRGRIEIARVHHVHHNADITIGTHLVEGARYESGRIPWGGGAGSVVLHEDRPGLRDEFGDFVEWFRAGDLDHFRQKLTELTNNPAKIAEKSSQLREFVLRRHTWQHRAAQIVEQIGLL